MPRSKPGVLVEVLVSPLLYAPAQIRRALDIAWRLQRGKLVLVEPPQGSEAEHEG